MNGAPEPTIATGYESAIRVERGPEERNNLWDDDDHQTIRAGLEDRLLSEIVGDERGDPVAISLRQPLEPVGSFRDPAHREKTKG